MVEIKDGKRVLIICDRCGKDETKGLSETCGRCGEWLMEYPDHREKD